MMFDLDSLGSQRNTSLSDVKRVKIVNNDA